ncbi:MAG TPA: proline--tRNA ligase [Methylomirabilota bacterium]|nr:proline--tRNA ligase [Methylomirabilota bacterium]
MRWTQTFIHTLRQDPSDAEVVSHRLMVRAGFISKVAAGIYNYLPLATRSIAKLSAIIREEMVGAGSAELVMPAVQPAELWQDSGRWAQYGPELLRIKDRHDRDFCFGPTHEEVVTDIVRGTVTSYRQLPVNLFQIQTKFRDEIRPRFGLMRGREFIMKDAYSFHADADDLDVAYRAMERAYRRVFTRCGLRFTQVEADTGNIGGSESHEFMVLAATGEDAILSCPDCGYGANVEKAETGALVPAPPWPLEAADRPRAVDTPEQRTIEEVSGFLGIDPAHLVKTLIFETEEELVAVLIRGDLEVNEVKLGNALDCLHLQLASEQKILEVTGGPQGFSGPVGLEGVRIVADPSVMALATAATGANRDQTHLVGVVPGRDFSPDLVAELRLAVEGDPCPRCDGRLVEERGIEVGHVFKLGTKYSQAMRCNFLDAEGGERPMIMGCYGLGVGRTVAAAVEQNHDDKGIVWPLPLAPYEVVLVLLTSDQEAVVAAAEDLYRQLADAGVDVLFDDRPERPGVKFNDMDLIGFPVRVVVGKRGLDAGEVELSLRRDGERRPTPIGDLVPAVTALLDELRAPLEPADG